MADLYRRGVRIFNFHDDNFLPARRAERFARVRALKAALETRGMGRIAFAIKARPDAMEDELLELLLSMGLFRVFLGIEAGTPKLWRARPKAEGGRQHLRARDREPPRHPLLLQPARAQPELDPAGPIGQRRVLAKHPRNPMNSAGPRSTQARRSSYVAREGRLPRLLEL